MTDFLLVLGGFLAGFAVGWIAMAKLGRLAIRDMKERGEIRVYGNGSVRNPPPTYDRPPPPPVPPAIRRFREGVGEIKD